jgi:hypothetical protein
MLGLTGTGADDDQLTVDPPAMNLGTVQVGTSASQSGTLFAGGSQVTISSATSSNPEFVLSGLSFPLTIPPGGRQGFLVTFTPQATGLTSGTHPSWMSPGPILSQLKSVSASVGSRRVTASIFPGSQHLPEGHWL